MVNGLVKLVQRAAFTVSLVGLLSCCEPSYSSTPMLPIKGADVSGAMISTDVRDQLPTVVSPPKGSYGPHGDAQSLQSMYRSFMEEFSNLVLTADKCYNPPL